MIESDTRIDKIAGDVIRSTTVATVEYTIFATHCTVLVKISVTFVTSVSTIILFIQTS